MHPYDRPRKRESAPAHIAPPDPVSPALIALAGVSIIAADAVLLPATSARVTASQVVVVRGANGAGKTTLLRVLAGRIAPTTGSARIAERAIDERDPAFRRRVAAMIGLPPMAPDLTVQEHLALVAATWYSSATQARRAEQSTLAAFELEPLATRFPGELSSGQTQLLGLAMVFVRPFDVLLLDEPEQRLDPHRVSLVATEILARKQSGATIIVATHSETLASLIADQTLHLGGAL